MVLFGRELGAEEAVARGLASEIAPPEEVLDRAPAGAGVGKNRIDGGTRGSVSIRGITTERATANRTLGK